MSGDEAERNDGAGATHDAPVISKEKSIESPKNIQEIRQAVEISSLYMLVKLLPLVTLHEFSDRLSQIVRRAANWSIQPVRRSIRLERVARLPDLPPHPMG